MRKLRFLAVLLLAAASFAAFGQSAIIRGEAAPGSYVNIYAINTPGDTSTNSVNGMVGLSYNFLTNGATWDRWGNLGSVTTGGTTNLRAAAVGTIAYPGGEVTWLSSAARTSTQTLADQTNYFARGILVACNVTVAPGVETLTISVQRKDSLSGVYTTIAANTATTATGMITLKLNPNFVAVAASATGQTANDILGPVWKLVATHSAAGSWTYSCSYTLITAS